MVGIGSPRLSQGPACAVIGTLICLAAAAAHASARQSVPAAADGKRSIWSGVYSAAQAERGHIAYLRACTTCHHEDLAGDSAEEVPSLASAQFIEGWSGRTVKDLVDTISRTMPGDAPGSLDAATYVDLVAFILKSNKLPSGGEALPTDPALLERVSIEKAP